MVASRMRMMSAGGRCRPFDARADGFVRSEGCGAVLLKRALRRGRRRRPHSRRDPRFGGEPGRPEQRAHRAEQPLPAGGDPGGARERRRVAAADRLHRGARHRHAARRPDRGRGADARCSPATAATPGCCALGSAKANIGHAEGAAGVAALIKAVLTLRPARCRRSCTSNSSTRTSRWRHAVRHPDERSQPWPAAPTPRHAGVSSFGWSGTNAHVIVGEAPPEPAHPAHR